MARKMKRIAKVLMVFVILLIIHGVMAFWWAVMSHRTNRPAVLQLEHVARIAGYATLSEAELKAMVSQLRLDLPGNPYHASVSYSNETTWRVVLTPEATNWYAMDMLMFGRLLLCEYEKMDYPILIMERK